MPRFLRLPSPTPAALVVASLVAVACGQGPPERAMSRAEPVVPLASELPGAVLDDVVDDLADLGVPPGEEVPAPPPPGEPPPSVAAPPPPPGTAPPPAPEPAPAPPAPAPPARPVEVYAGLGTWIDAYDWSLTFGKDGPLVQVADIDRMADVGVQTLYVQTSRWNAPADVLEPERLLPLIERARARGMSVVAWYLPTLVDPQTDLRRLLAAAALPVDAVAVDIESGDVTDVAERNRRILRLSHELRHALPDTALAAIPYPPVALEVINPALWPDFPWRELDTYYDVWMPMSYSSFRTAASGYRDGYRYTAENIDRLRANLGSPNARVHTVGGIADAVSGADVDGMVRAAAERGAIGGSLYDWRTTSELLWPHLQGFRR
ncbi:MAG: hypothetical protein KY441_00555 [Actinobacteria bacterium]|nr:hypothetical protein [Actinomycetota bacterium]